MQNQTASLPVSDTESSARSAGRPRSEASRLAILDATRRLMTHTSVRDLSIEAIAKKAGVGKTTIYRWWPNKVAVVIEAFAEQLDMHMLTAGNETPSENLARQLDRLMRQLRGRNGKIIADLLAEAQSDAKVLEQFNQFYMQSRRNAFGQTILNGQKSGEFSEALNTEMAVDMILGPIFMRLMRQEAGLDEAFAAEYPVMAIHALSA
ncbi:MAG: TetR/AcrR family transcriptional regulator [Micavibrio aeruginosavorus]|nr:TetR/AcrR family transcriptional regulator [Micavibrio aeruginosavorus]